MLFISADAFAAVLVTRKSPPKKCRNCDNEVFWGVGASGSTMASTYDTFCMSVAMLVVLRRNWGSIAVSVT